MERSSSEMTGTWLSLSNDVASAVAQVGRAVVAVNGRRRIPSSGVHLQQGVIVTADHTVERDEEVTITLPEGRSVRAALVGRDPTTDLAVLKLEKVKLPIAETGDSSSLRVGHIVLAVGRTSTNGLSASLGVISVLEGVWHTWRGGEIDQFIRPDLTLYPGFSGGPLVDTRGLVVGINTSGLSRHFGITIPAVTIDRVIKELLTRGHIRRGYLGLGMYPVPLPDNLSSKLNLANRAGLIIFNLETDGPADRAGILLGDVLVSLDGNPVNDTDDVQAALGSQSVGKMINASVIRDGKLVERAIKVGERPRSNE
jgi:S1-C subfamily serine protease